MSRLDPYDAVLLLSFGGPERDEDVMPFLRHVTGGRGIPDERLQEVAHHYHLRGGVSPINGENRRLMAALGAELQRRGESVPIVWGNRHAEPFTEEALREITSRGCGRVVALVTSAYASYSGCRQYREDLADVAARLREQGVEVPPIDKVRPYADHPGFVAAAAGRTVEGVAAFLAEHSPTRPHLAFVTHSIPDAMADTSGPEGHDYIRRHEEIAGLVAARVRDELGVDLPWSLVYCSRSGPPHQPWLEPDVNDHIAALAADGVDGVIVDPIGFVADHMEVVHDLDTEAAATAADLGVAFVRIPTVQDDPRFVAGLVDLLEERAAEARGESPDRASVGTPLPSACRPGCCRNLRGERPALCGADDPAATGGAR